MNNEASRDFPATEDLEPMRDMAWPEVFAFWRENEGHNPAWLRLAAERGFDSWEAWRKSYVGPLGLERRAWRLYRVRDPLRLVPTFRGGPFRAWIDGFYGDAGPMPSFADIAERLDRTPNAGVASLEASFPAHTTVTGVLTDGGIVIVEGMHRCAAIARLAAAGRPLSADLTIALGSALPEPLPIVGGHRADGSPT